MERVTWTDERLDDLSRRVDAGFARLDADVRELRAELRTEIGGLRNELRGEIGGLRGEMRSEFGALRLIMLRGGGGIMVGLVGVIGTVLVAA